MEITQEKLNELKSQIKIQEPLGTLIQNSLVVGGKPENELIRRAAVSPDCQSFDFGISSVLKISGSICKSGKLDIVVIAFGIEIGHTTVDVSKGEFCQNPKIGELVGVKYCFYPKNNCLYTRGELDGWFAKIVEWNEKLLCFPEFPEKKIPEVKGVIIDKHEGHTKMGCWFGVCEDINATVSLEEGPPGKFDFLANYKGTGLITKEGTVPIPVSGNCKGDVTPTKNVVIHYEVAEWTLTEQSIHCKLTVSIEYTGFPHLGPDYIFRDVVFGGPRQAVQEAEIQARMEQVVAKAERFTKAAGMNLEDIFKA